MSGLHSSRYLNIGPSWHRFYNMPEKQSVPNLSCRPNRKVAKIGKALETVWNIS
jgi:hypothetical protein